MRKRSSGILLHISSLPGKYGIGDFGQSAYRFIDFLAKSKQKNWQILPLGITSYGDSPYQSFSAFAGNPYFIDFDQLLDLEYLSSEDLDKVSFGKDLNSVDYNLLYINKMNLLNIAYQKAKFTLNKELNIFYKENFMWLRDFALFMTIKKSFNDVSWLEWDHQYQLYNSDTVLKFEENNQEEIFFWVFTQYLFSKQWQSLKKYANQHQVKIIGDLPIYVSVDSADVWSQPELYNLDKDFNPITVAGCPPDAFSSLGQLWGNPIYNWDKMHAQEFNWWIDRFDHSFKLYDTLRIDHFRGFASYCEIDFGKENALEHVWSEGPGIKLFETIKKKLGDLDIIVEDLGYITEDVISLVKETGFPNMKVIVFGLNAYEDSEHLLHNFYNNMVVYTTTHDNQPLMGWLEETDIKHKQFAKKYFNVIKDEDFSFQVVKGAWSSVANLAIAPIQDILGLSNSARMNTPSQIGGNWQFRIKAEDLSDDLAFKLQEITTIYQR
ncbi:MAG: 4-alpha-glucanotransferase [Erysipelothrix sp.]|nr:4-alpha-glucanotransferase [Erysipelothrix sp.]